jgi:hypothetical protein
MSPLIQTSAELPTFTVNTVIAPAVSKPAALAGIVGFVRNQKNDTMPPPRFAPSSLAAISGQPESSNPPTPAYGSIS